MSALRKTVSLPQAVALYIGGIFGTGLLVLPAQAAETAGPASLIAWAALIGISFPMSLTFAALARAYPEAGGPAAYAERAFGPIAGAITGWLFFFSVPPAAMIAALIAKQYAAT